MLLTFASHLRISVKSEWAVWPVYEGLAQLAPAEN